MSNTYNTNETSACNKSFIELIQDLRDILRSNEYKHTSLITVNKAVIYPIIDALYSKALNLKPVRNCDTCKLYQYAYDEAVASATIDRLLAYADGNNSPVTKDEAENLARLFDTKLPLAPHCFDDVLGKD